MREDVVVITNRYHEVLRSAFLTICNMGIKRERNREREKAGEKERRVSAQTFNIITIDLAGDVTNEVAIMRKTLTYHSLSIIITCDGYGGAKVTVTGLHGVLRRGDPHPHLCDPKSPTIVTTQPRLYPVHCHVQKHCRVRSIVSNRICRLRHARCVESSASEMTSEARDVMRFARVSTRTSPPPHLLNGPPPRFIPSRSWHNLLIF